MNALDNANLINALRV